MLGVGTAGKQIWVKQNVGAGGREEEGEDLGAGGRRGERGITGEVDGGQLGVTKGNIWVTLRFRVRKIGELGFSLYLNL